MQVFIGGAHNGKRAYVKKMLAEQEKHNIDWVEGSLPWLGRESIVVAGLENWLRSCELSEEQAIHQIMQVLENRDAIVILTDVGRGIVPMDAGQRQLRDTCGRLYQRIMAEADEVTRIWYGIPQIIKKGENFYENIYKNRG